MGIFVALPTIFERLNNFYIKLFTKLQDYNSPYRINNKILTLKFKVSNSKIIIIIIIIIISILL